jgi:hypothetical protein
MSIGVPVCWKLPSFSRLPADGACAKAGEVNATTSADAAPKRVNFMVSSMRPFSARTLRRLSHNLSKVSCGKSVESLNERNGGRDRSGKCQGRVGLRCWAARAEGISTP